VSAFFTAQMDYIFFVYGLSFFLLAVTVYFLHRAPAACSFWKWIALFGFLHGISRWLEMLALNSGHDALWLIVVRLIFLAASFLCLVEIARADLQKRFGRICGLWVYIPLLAVVAGLGWMMDGWLGINVLVRYIFGVIGGLLAARVVYREGVRADQKNSWLVAFAAILGGYALTQMIVPASSVFPASVINQPVFLERLGVPIQLCRIPLSVALAFLAWKKYLQQRYAHVAQKKSSYAQIGVIFLSVLSIFVLLGWAATEFLGEKRMEEKKKVLFSLAQYSAQAINVKEVAALTGTVSDLETQNYKDLFKDALGVYLRYPDAASVYMFGRRDGKHIFLYDSTNPKKIVNVPAAEPGEVYELDADILADMFRNGGTVLIGPEADKWGNFMSGFSAIRSSEKGPVIAVLGVDYNVDEWVDDVAQYRCGAIMVTALFVLIFVMFFFIYLRQKEVQQNLKDRERRLLELSRLLEEERGNLETIFNSSLRSAVLIQLWLILSEKVRILLSVIVRGWGLAVSIWMPSF
jgi:hypothetical protein